MKRQDECFRKNLRRLREEHRYNQIDMATIMDITQPHYSQLENGTKRISLEHLVKVVDAFEFTGLSLNYFIEGRIKPQ